MPYTPGQILTASSLNAHVCCYNGSLASASSVACANGGLYLVTGTTTISTITSGQQDQLITLEASGQAAGIPVVVNNSGNIQLRGGVTALGLYAGESLTLVYSGSAWVEVARSLRPVISETQKTSDTSSGGGGTVDWITMSAITFDGVTAFDIEAFSPGWANGNNGGGTATLHLQIDGSDLSVAQWWVQNAFGIGTGAPFYYKHGSYVPSSGSHTFKTRIQDNTAAGLDATGGTGTAGAKPPAWMRVIRSGLA